MKPVISDTNFGSITIDGKIFEHDVIIDPDGIVSKRKKKLSKAIYGTSHIISLDEVKYVYKGRMDSLIIGTGQYGMVSLSDEAKAFLHKKNCGFTLQPTPEAIIYWNQYGGNAGGLFHITC